MNKQLQKEQTKQKKVDPMIARGFLLSLRDHNENDMKYRKMLVNALIDRIYLYDDHFRILLTHSGRKGKVSLGYRSPVEYREKLLVA